jgi:hypothetical protein
MTEAEIREQIEYLVALITNLRAAILALSSGTVNSYSIGTGQTTQWVSKKNLNTLRAQLELSLMDLQMYRQMLTDDGGEILRAL